MSNHDSLTHTLLVCQPESCDVIALAADLILRLSTYPIDGAGARASMCNQHLTVPAAEHAAAMGVVLPPNLAPDSFAGVNTAPLRLCDFGRARASIAVVAARNYAQWSQRTSGLPPAASVRQLLDANGKPSGQATQDRLIEAFMRQPMVRRMIAAGFPRDMFGPALAALQAGPHTYRDYLTNLTLYGTVAHDLDGTWHHALPPPCPPMMMRPSDIAAHATRVQSILDSLPPATIITYLHLPPTARW